MNTDYTDKNKEFLLLKTIQKICVDLCPNVFDVPSSQGRAGLIHPALSPSHGQTSLSVPLGGY
jgi:hypothetical protein